MIRHLIVRSLDEIKKEVYIHKFDCKRCRRLMAKKHNENPTWHQLLLYDNEKSVIHIIESADK